MLNRSVRTLLAAILVIVTLSSMGLALGGCKKTGSATFTVKKWDDVQKTIDNAKSNDIIDLSKLSTPDKQHVLEVGNGINMTFVGNPDELFYGVAINCGGENSITLHNIRLVSTNNQTPSTLQFTSWGNQLTLLGDNVLINAQAPEKLGHGAAVGVADGTTLTISGTGSLTARGGSCGAGIGGGLGLSAGTIIIRESSIVAYGGGMENTSGAPAIGGGLYGSGGTISISGGKVIAIAGPNSAAIGDGMNASGGVIGISGGDITAETNENSEEAAIKGTLETLPGAYTWWAGKNNSVGQSDGKSFPDDSFKNSSAYKFIRIRAR